MKTHARLFAVVLTLAFAVLPASAQFTITTVESPAVGAGDVGLNTSQAILANGNPAIACYDGASLRYVRASDATGTSRHETIPK